MIMQQMTSTPWCEEWVGILHVYYVDNYAMDYIGLDRKQQFPDFHYSMICKDASDNIEVASMYMCGLSVQYTDRKIARTYAIKENLSNSVLPWKKQHHYGRNSTGWLRACTLKPVRSVARIINNYLYGIPCHNSGII